jgi:hypothetical protein
MITIHFGYEKPKVLQALRYHFISRPEIRLMLILINAFWLSAITLYFFNKVTPFAFVLGSFVWFGLMISFWFILPYSVYKRAVTFRHEFNMDFTDEGFSLRHDRGSKSWPWTALKHYLESPHFFHLYFDNRSFLLVPKSGCSSDEEVFELRKLINEYVKKG